VGRFLRNISLGELPQLLNVLRGDMSLVSPRPHSVSHHRMYAEPIQGYSERHRMRPGITGWVQVDGLRGETEALEKMRSRAEDDRMYIEN
jgi:putative colanic acid biosynthesis UDP-glucose lipid carrier transferase